MGEEQTSYKVTDRRLFNPDGTPRDVPEDERPETKPAETSAPAANAPTEVSASAVTPPREATADADGAGRVRRPRGWQRRP